MWPHRLLLRAIELGSRMVQILHFSNFFRKNPRALAELTRSPRLQLSSADAARPCEQHAPRGPRIAAPPARQPRCRTKLPARLPCRSTELHRHAAAQPGSTVAKPYSPPSPERAGVAEPRHSDTLLGKLLFHVNKIYTHEKKS